MKFNKETLASAVFVVFRVLLWLPVLAVAVFFGAALGDLLVSFAAEHLSPAAVGILAGLLTLTVVRSKPPLHTPFERMEQFKQKHHLDRLASFQLEFTLLCMVAFFLSISGIAVFSAAFDSLCAEDLIVPVGWIVCTYLCLFVSSFFIFNLFDLVILWSALSILAVGCALLVSFPSYAVYVPLTAAFGAAALFLGAAAGPAFLKKMEDDAALFCMLRRLRLAEIAVYLLFLLLGQNGMLTLSGLRINLFLTSMIFPLIVLEFCILAFLQPFRHRRLEACFAALFHCILLYCGGCPGGDLLLTAALCVLVLLVTAPQPHPQRRHEQNHSGFLWADPDRGKSSGARCCGAVCRTAGPAAVGRYGSKPRRSPPQHHGGAHCELFCRPDAAAHPGLHRRAAQLSWPEPALAGRIRDQRTACPLRLHVPYRTVDRTPADRCAAAFAAGAN